MHVRMCAFTCVHAICKHVQHVHVSNSCAALGQFKLAEIEQDCRTFFTHQKSKGITNQIFDSSIDFCYFPHSITYIPLPPFCGILTCVLLQCLQAQCGYPKCTPLSEVFFYLLHSSLKNPNQTEIPMKRSHNKESNEKMHKWLYWNCNWQGDKTHFGFFKILKLDLSNFSMYCINGLSKIMKRKSS